MSNKPEEDEAQAPKFGPKPLYGDEAMRNRTVKMTDEHWLKCLRLGGSAWVRERIERAREPK